MKKIFLVAVSFIFLTACSSSSIIESNSNNISSVIVNQGSNEGIAFSKQKPTVEPTAEPAVEPTVEPDSSAVEHNVTIIQTLDGINDQYAKDSYSNRLSENFKKFIPLEAYKAVLQNEHDFFSMEDKKVVHLNEFNYFNGMALESPFKVKRFAVLDLDGDKTPEVILELATDLESQCIEVLHYKKNIVYGYSFVYRALIQIKTDGTFSFSSGAADRGFGKLRFSSNTCETDILGYSESGYNNDVFNVSYYINKKSVTEESFIAFCERQEEKEDIVWHEFSQENIQTEFSSLANSLVEDYEVANTFIPEFNNIIDIMNMDKNAVIKRLGNDYKIVAAGPEDQQEGYRYSKYGITLTFSSIGTSEIVDTIYCNEMVDIKGARNGMTFAEIEGILGKSKVVGDEDYGYHLSYEYDGILVWFWAQSRNNPTHDLEVRRFVLP